MSFSYNPSLSRPLDKVRFTIQDTTDPAELSDEELLALYDATNTDIDGTLRIQQAAYGAALALYRRYSKMITFSADGASFQHTQRAKQWKEVLDAIGTELQPSWAQVIYTDRQVEVRHDFLPEAVLGVVETWKAY